MADGSARGLHGAPLLQPSPFHAHDLRACAALISRSQLSLVGIRELSAPSRSEQAPCHVGKPELAGSCSFAELHQSAVSPGANWTDALAILVFNADAPGVHSRAD